VVRFKLNGRFITWTKKTKNQKRKWQKQHLQACMTAAGMSHPATAFAAEMSAALLRERLVRMG
jgi:hypothetical protein